MRVHAAVDGAPRVVGVADALDDQRQRGQRSQPGQVVPRQRVAEDLDPAHDRRLRVLLGRLLQAGAEHRVAGVVGQAVPAQEREVRRRQVARPPAGNPGVQRDDDALEARRLGAAHQAGRHVAVGRACRAGKSLGCRRIRRRPAPSGRPTSSTRSSARRCGRRRALSPGRRARPARTRPMTPTGAIIAGDGSVSPKQVHRQVAFVGADEHPRHQPPAVEGGAR